MSGRGLNQAIGDGGSRQSASGVLRDKIERHKRETEQMEELLDWLEGQEVPKGVESLLWSLLISR